MPHLLFRGVTPDQVRSVSSALVGELAGLCQCPEDHFLLECLATTAVSGGRVVPSYPFVEVSWFDRGPEAQDRFAGIVDCHVRQGLDLPELEIAFNVYREDRYYINGERAGNRREEWPAAELLQELASLRESNARLRGQLQKTTRKSPSDASVSHMSSRLRDALRE